MFPPTKGEKPGSTTICPVMQNHESNCIQSVAAFFNPTNIPTSKCKLLRLSKTAALFNNPLGKVAMQNNDVNSIKSNCSSGLVITSEENQVQHLCRGR